MLAFYDSRRRLSLAWCFVARACSMKPDGAGIFRVPCASRLGPSLERMAGVPDEALLMMRKYHRPCFILLDLSSPNIDQFWTAAGTLGSSPNIVQHRLCRFVGTAPRISEHRIFPVGLPTGPGPLHLLPR